MSKDTNLLLTKGEINMNDLGVILVPYFLDEDFVRPIAENLHERYPNHFVFMIGNLSELSAIPKTSLVYVPDNNNAFWDYLTRNGYIARFYSDLPITREDYYINNYWE